MSDRHRGASSIDLRLARRINRALGPRLVPLVLLVSAILTGAWYATHWRRIWLIGSMTPGGVSPDVAMGALAALFFTLGVVLGLAAQPARRWLQAATREPAPTPSRDAAAPTSQPASPPTPPPTR